MKTLAIAAAKHAALTSGISFSAMPALGSATLDGFALGAVITAVYFTVLNSPARKALASPVVAPGARKRASVRWRRREAASGRTDLITRASTSVRLGRGASQPPASSRLRLPSAWPIPGQAGRDGADGDQAVAQPRHAQRSEETRPYALALVPELTEQARLDLAPRLPDRRASGRMARLRRRLDVMMAELLSDDPEEAVAPPPEQADSGFWGPEERRNGPAGGRHRLTDPGKAPARPAGTRVPPRHAAPSAG